MRQALAGMLWTKQFYYYDVDRWLEERGADPFKPTASARRATTTGTTCTTATSSRCRTSGSTRGTPPGTWPFTSSRSDAGRSRLRQAAARADAAASVTCTPTARSRPTSGTSATSIRRCMPGPRSSSTGWRKRSAARATSSSSSAASTSCCSISPGGSTARTAPASNVFEGGFLGLDNIGVFDRSAPLPTGGYLEQADGTAWMALFCQNMLEIAVELAIDRSRLRGHGTQVRRALPVDRLGA